MHRNNVCEEIFIVQATCRNKPESKATHVRTILLKSQFGTRGDALSEHTQQRLPQVLKPETEYATFAYVEHAERPPTFLIQKSPPLSWRYRKQVLHCPQMGARRFGKRAKQRRPPSVQKSDRYPSNHEVREGATKRRRSGQERVATFQSFVYTFVI